MLIVSQQVFVFWAPHARDAFAFSSGIDWQNSHASPDIGYDLQMDKDAPGEYLESGIYSPGGLDRVMR